jgi:hypothetical protein
MFIKRALKVFVIGLIAFALATLTYAYAATNTVPAGKAGAGSGNISGYTISNVTYTLDASNPVNITAVAFTLDAGAITVRARLVTGGTLFNCSGGPTNWTCTISGVTVSAANTLEVDAAQ